MTKMKKMHQGLSMITKYLPKSNKSFIARLFIQLYYMVVYWTLKERRKRKSENNKNENVKMTVWPYKEGQHIEKKNEKGRYITD